MTALLIASLLYVSVSGKDGSASDGRADGRVNLESECKMEDNCCSASVKQSIADCYGLLPVASSFFTLAGGLSKRW